MPRFYIENFGCRATQADGSAIERQLEQQGLSRSEAGQAEIVILNTCTVTAAADQDARAAIRRIHRQNPTCKILVTGCYAQRAPEEVAALPGVTSVIGNSHKQQLAGVAARMIGASSSNFVPLRSLSGSRTNDYSQLLVGDIFAHTELIAAPVFESSTNATQTRPNLKIQDGCNNRCSFCIIPYVRGQSRSLHSDEVLREVMELEQAGYREIVLSGINLGRWGRDLEKQSRFEELLQLILELTSIEKIRISSVEPMDWTDNLIQLVANSPRIAKHAHLPLQSGSDRILRRMHRKYRPWHYADKILKIRKLMPDAAIGADVMVGFPGEDDAAFEETRSFIEQLPFTYLHVFTYSSRPGTPSAAMPDQVPVNVARARNKILRELVAEKNREFRKHFIGKSLQAITLSEQNEDSTEALSDNYLKLRVHGHHAANRWLDVVIESLNEEGLVGRVCSLPV